MKSRWRRRTFESVGLTEYPPGPNLERLVGPRKVYVTQPGYDNIGAILTSMGVKFEPFQGAFDCTLLFVNCGTSDPVDPSALAEFVRAGGCLYASDHIDGLITQAFPGIFEFAGHVGNSGNVTADVLDPELRDVLGQQITIEFDMPAWSVLHGGKAEPLLRSAKGSQQAGRPIMAYAEYGEGSIFYTCFHNKGQISDREKGLLQLLVVKQFSATSHQSFEQTGRALGLKLDEMRGLRR
jgi:hypothetical protein